MSDITVGTNVIYTGRGESPTDSFIGLTGIVLGIQHYGNDLTFATVRFDAHTVSTDVFVNSLEEHYPVGTVVAIKGHPYITDTTGTVVESGVKDIGYSRLQLHDRPGTIVTSRKVYLSLPPEEQVPLADWEKALLNGFQAEPEVDTVMVERTLLERAQLALKNTSYHTLKRDLAEALSTPLEAARARLVSSIPSDLAGDLKMVLDALDGTALG